ncbi:hypothetical protein HN51_070241 [Arachis hypogaea]
MAPTFRGVVVVEETAAVVVGVMKVDAVATAAIVVEESKAAWVSAAFVPAEAAKIQVAAPDHSQETRSHLGVNLIRIN